MAGSSSMERNANIQRYNTLMEDATKRQRTSAPSSEFGNYMTSNFLSHFTVEEFHNFDILAWWKENEPQFPILAVMARDLLIVQASTDYLDGVERIQHCVSLEGELLPPVKEYIHEEEVAMEISPTMTELDEGEVEELSD
ncbi:hypothetical protein L2E82_01818 [Cichorium intybus]|uniref:Uncharacterized protein n=1 Tax=Cichorium intybus TaxID=13427 RepID=A0ACB9H114_CICIN|nr:hypothetical protein L2E82_01818 [Cichorium intybus]